jgi:ubiquitin C-terminal hydrolase
MFKNFKGYQSFRQPALLNIKESSFNVGSIKISPSPKNLINNFEDINVDITDVNDDILPLESDYNTSVELRNKLHTGHITRLLNLIGNSIPQTIIRMEGIKNLGNTCYINSVLQVLSFIHLYHHNV